MKSQPATFEKAHRSIEDYLKKSTSEVVEQDADEADVDEAASIRHLRPSSLLLPGNQLRNSAHFAVGPPI